MKKEYKEDYKKINPKTLKEVRAVVKAGLFKANPKDRLELLKRLNIKLAKIYKVTIPNIEVNRSVGEGCYIPAYDVIMLNERLSLVTYLHEFKHQLQFKKSFKNSEDIARGWSISVFAKATPKLYRSAVEKGLIIHEN